MEYLEAHQVSSFIKIDFPLCEVSPTTLVLSMKPLKLPEKDGLWPEGEDMMTSLKNFPGILTFPLQVLPLEI